MEVNATTRGTNLPNEFNAIPTPNVTVNTNSSNQISGGREAGRSNQMVRTPSANLAPSQNNAQNLREELAELQESISAEFFDRFVQEANSRLMPDDRKFAYDFHEATNRIVVRVVDRNTDEVIREIPPEKILRATEKMLELVGVLFDESV
jgi:flagellar protein FlaG